MALKYISTAEYKLIGTFDAGKQTFKDIKINTRSYQTMGEVSSTPKKFMLAGFRKTWWKGHCDLENR